MNRKKLDNRIKTIIDNGVQLGHRSLFVLVGNKGRDQVVTIHHILTKSNFQQADLLWCYKEELSMSSHRKKRVKQIKNKIEAGGTTTEDNLFEIFVTTTEIRYCYYKETKGILGNTFNMCVLQDFESLTPNILCRTVETVQGGGIVVFLLQSKKAMKQFFTIHMDINSRYRNERNAFIVPRFSERFILSLGFCEASVVINDKLEVIPIASHLHHVVPVPKNFSTDASPNEKELKMVKEKTKEVEPVGTLVNLCKTLDQANALLQFYMVITAKKLNTTVSLTAARGRGKSATMGIAIAGAVAFGYRNIYVTSPSPENLNTFFEFVIIGLKALKYEEDLQFQVFHSQNPDFHKAVMRISITGNDQQFIQYISPKEYETLGTAEIVVIDEAAAIPLPMVKKLMGPYLVFLSSTILGYEGTGRSLSLKLLKQLRDDSKQDGEKGTSKKRKLAELTLDESIRYKSGDPVEKWLYDLLCLDATPAKVNEGVLAPSDLELFYVNRDVLFSHHEFSEKILNSIMGLLVTSHYKNSPDDLQTLSDAPGHHLFALLSPSKDKNKLPKIVVVIQVCMEGKISKAIIQAYSKEKNKPIGDLIPWNMINIYQDDDFPQMSGCRIVRIATHPDLQGKGYGSEALRLLEEYFAKTAHKAGLESTLTEDVPINVVNEEEIAVMEENMHSKSSSKPLFYSLDQREPEALHYIGVSYGSSIQLLNYWKTAGYTVVYVSSIPNKLTGEHSTLMLKVLAEKKENRKESWLLPFYSNYRISFMGTLGNIMRHLSCPLALSLLESNIYKKKLRVESGSIDPLSTHALNRLEEYAFNGGSFYQFIQIIHKLAMIYFDTKTLRKCKLDSIQIALLCGVGLMNKKPAQLAEELQLDEKIIMGRIHDMAQRISRTLKSINSIESMDTT